MIFELITLQTQKYAQKFGYQVRIKKVEDICEVDIYDIVDSEKQDVLYYILAVDELRGNATISFHLITGEVRKKEFSIDFSEQIKIVLQLIKGIIERVHQFRLNGDHL